MAKKDVKITESMYQVLLSPVVTEKSTMVAESNTLTFKVKPEATKPEIKEAVEALYKVKVESVNTSPVKGKTKRFRGHTGQRSDWKKAFVRLADGQSVDLSAGI
ncbi:MAG: 50S ribosomal protein L23 [Proteobacteria bacterium]|nr:50S ribosomal protein L23 [Pseudomonadota bacterium]